MNLYKALSDKLARQPDLVVQALEELGHWEEQGFAPAARLSDWRRLLENARQTPQGMAELQNLLKDDSESARRLRDFAPLAGLLTREERRAIFLACTYDH